MNIRILISIFIFAILFPFGETISQVSAAVKKFKVDGYATSVTQFKCDDRSSSCEIKYKNLISTNKRWFTNDTLNQTLVFELYTDNYRNIIYHFLNSDIPGELIKRMEIEIEGGESAPLSEKLKNFKAKSN